MKKAFKTITCAILAASLACTMLLSLSGCGSEKNDSQSLASPEESDIELEMNTQSDESEQETADTPAGQEKLESILEALLKEDSDYSSFKAYYPPDHFSESIEGDKLLISESGENENDPKCVWEFIQDGDYIVLLNSGDEDYTGVVLFLYVASAVAETLGMNPTLVCGYINGISVMNIESDKFSVETNDDGSTNYKLYMAAPFEMTELNDMYLGDEMLGEAQPLTDEYISSTMSIGKVSVTLNGSKNSLKMLVSEYGGFDDVGVRSAVNVVSAFKPNGHESFAEGFKAFENAETDAYSVSTNVSDSVIADIVGEKTDGYSYALITFDKDET